MYRLSGVMDTLAGADTVRPPTIVRTRRSVLVAERKNDTIICDSKFESEWSPCANATPVNSDKTDSRRINSSTILCTVVSITKGFVGDGGVLIMHRN